MSNPGNTLTEEEITAQGMAMVTFLHRHAADLMGRIAALEGEKAILEKRLQNANEQLKQNAAMMADKDKAEPAG